MLGRVQPQWEDMSPEVIHITRGLDASQSYVNLIQILDSGFLEARNPFGAARQDCPDPASQRAVCFTEVPIHLVSRIIQRRLPQDPAAWNGIAFNKRFVVERGGGPIMYAYDGTPHAEALQAMMQSAWACPDPAAHPVWKLTPFVDRPGRHGTYYWDVACTFAGAISAAQIKILNLYNAKAFYASGTILRASERLLRFVILDRS